MPQRLLLVGALYCDTLLTVPSYPAEDAKQRATSTSKRLGGNTINSATVLSQLVLPEQLELYLCCVLPREEASK